MCPWPRIQAALTDEHALNVTYRYDRGEPRGSVKKSAVLREQGLPAGDCVDCHQCVYVCPTGIDIREGANLGCIQCGLCIDACDNIMEKIGRPQRLIAYDTDLNIKRRQRGENSIYNVVRARTILYVALIVVVGGAMMLTLAMRHNEAISVIHDRNPLFVRLADGAVRNAYTIRIINKRRETREFRLSVAGVSGVFVEVVGASHDAASRPVIEIGPDQTREVRVLVTDYIEPVPSSRPISFHIQDVATGERASASDHFRGP
jgi:cytochrome c oxidase accessory protein FixG